MQYLSSNNDHLIRDIWDGSSMKNTAYDHSSKTRTLSLLTSTDGVPLFKSSTISLWPMSFVILNLPPAIRMNSENIVLAGFWVGSKPPMKLLFQPIIEDLKYFSSNSFKVSTSSGIFDVFINLVMGVFDLPAKAAVLNAKQFNGKHGCSVCVHPGQQLPNGTRIYLPHKYSERAHLGVMNNASSTEQTNQVVKGIKGTSLLSSVLDLVDSVPVDYMHTVLLGVVKLLLTRWFDSTNHNEPFYLGCHSKFIDSKLIKQCPPVNSAVAQDPSRIT